MIGFRGAVEAGSVVGGLASVLVCMASVAGAAQPAPPAARSSDDSSARRRVWVERLLEQLDHLPDSGDRSLAVNALAEAGETRLAKSLVEEKLPEPERGRATAFIAAAQSARGDIPGAVETLSGLPQESQFRAFGQSLAAIRRAQCGDVVAAQRLIKGLEESYFLDCARKEIAEAQARAGDRRSAAATADLIRDECQQREARAAITASVAAGSFSPEEIPSPFLSGTIAALSLFSNDSEWKTDALLALAAAYRKDQNGLDAAAERTLAQLKTVPKGLDRATGYSILAVAFSEAGASAQAQSAGDEALEAMSSDLVGVSGLFGKPIVVYAMIRVGQYDEIDKIVRAAERTQDDPIAGDSPLEIEAIGAALVDNHEYERLDETYQQLRKPANRTYLCIGALAELVPSLKPVHLEGGDVR